MKGKITEFGFEFGPAEIVRACSDEKKGWVIILLKTAKHPKGIQLYITKTGKVRVYSDKGELTERKEITT